jgi:hypothetical protein
VPLGGLDGFRPSSLETFGNSIEGEIRQQIGNIGDTFVVRVMAYDCIGTSDENLTVSGCIYL